MTTAPQSLAALAAQHGPGYRWRVLMTVMIGSIASVMSSTIVNVAVPDLMHYFAIGQERAQWVATGFMAATCIATSLAAVSSPSNSTTTPMRVPCR